MEPATDLCLHEGDKVLVQFVSGPLVVQVEVCFFCAVALTKASAQLLAAYPEEQQHA